ncbi:PoNi-like cognate immunity protein [Chromohalobacter israelensis]|uniref:PoNi-like cognate immunity protein n=1 Tax=Chromohalobacter israelensis TaxID=141390 RepID=UPI00211B0B0D|nr:PoNi-like cognate immunity protein [Chromohalobacter salexigens]
MGDEAFWNRWVSFDEKTIDEKEAELKKVPENVEYEPQFVWGLAKNYYLEFILRRYSRGDDIRELDQHFPGLFDAWELSNRLAYELNAQLEPGQKWDHRRVFSGPRLTEDDRGHTDPRAWVFELSNLNHYNFCFWLVGLALSLEIPDDQWQRLLVLIGGEGEDVLLDRVIASRQPERPVGTMLLHPKPYARLLAAVDAPKEQQAERLRDFVVHWYPELKRKGNEELWWYIFGDPEKHPLKMGSYFGRWCLEAVAAVKAFGLDDTLCLGHEHYPGDLLRPEGPSTHPVRTETQTKAQKGWLSRLLRR